MFQNHILGQAARTEWPSRLQCRWRVFERLLTRKTPQPLTPSPQENREVGDWRKNIDALSGMEGRKKKFEG